KFTSLPGRAGGLLGIVHAAAVHVPGAKSAKPRQQPWPAAGQESGCKSPGGRLQCGFPEIAGPATQAELVPPLPESEESDATVSV
ncbi:MAG: hypothetical protein KDA41_08335, partial [Planctomycetales bacterium]|nr:hypothetical protein [Planctomycetales bacterium]